MAQPEGTIYLFEDIALDSTYKNTLHFDNLTQQKRFFNEDRSSRQFSNQSYTRVANGIIRLAATAEQLQGTTYMAFQNVKASGYGKWYYAFVTSVLYINEGTTEIHFELDYMQTFYFDYNLGDCYIERAHATFDGLYANKVPEDFTPSEYTYETLQAEGGGTTAEDLFSIGGYIIATNANTVNPADGNKRASGGKFNGVFYPCDLLYFAAGEEGSLSLMIDAINDILPNSIIYVTTIPKLAAMNISTPDNNRKINTEAYSTYGMITVKPTHETISGYTPRNKKCFIYPYHYLVGSNSAGAISSYRFEDFGTDNEITFSCYTDLSENATVQVVPDQYKGVNRGLDFGFLTQSYPSQPYSTDQDAYFRQQEMNMRNQNVLSLKQQAVNATVGIISGGVSTLQQKTPEKYGAEGQGMIGAGLLSAIGVGQSAQQMSLMEDSLHKMNSLVAPTTNGMSGSSSIATLNQQMAPKFYVKNCQASEIQALDNYFTMYGYAIKEITNPGRYGKDSLFRESYSYIKTLGCSVHGSLPAEAVKIISSVYDNGVTFWRSNRVIGDYSNSNEVSYD